MKHRDFLRYRVAAIVATLTMAGPAVAQSGVTYKFSGFGTLGAVMTDTNNTQFRTSFDQQRGAGTSPDLGVDSKLAVQGSAIFPFDLTLTAQIQGRRREDEDFDARFEWLYAQYTGLSGFDFKAGRVVLPAFLVSDTRQVGYAIPWFRVPAMVYATMPVDTVDGYQAVYRHDIGPAVLSLQGTHGRGKGADMLTIAIPTGPSTFLYLPNVDHADLKDVLSLSATLEWGDWTGRIGSVTTDKVTIVGNLGGPPLVFKDRFTEFGLQYDNGKAVVAAEYVQRKTDPASVDLNAWYVAGGYRFGPVMPYVSYSRFTPKGFLIEALGSARNVGVGVRYDFATNMALKAEWATYKTNNYFIFTDGASPGAADRKVNTLSLALDFVF